MSIPRTVLEQAIWRDGHREFATVLPESRSFQFSPRSVRKLAATICSLTGAETRSVEATNHAELEDDLVRELVRQMSQKFRDVEGKPRTGSRAQHVRRARDYIDEHLNDSIALGRVATHAGVSVRTLELAFRAVLGVTPLEYIRTRRLNQVRQCLLDQRRKTRTLADVAVEHALFHFGRFSRDYKTLFDELPSETLMKSRRLRITKNRDIPHYVGTSGSSSRDE